MGFLFKSVSVIVNGQEHSLSNDDPYVWVGEDGLGAAPIERYAQAGAQQHGDTDVGFLLQPRQCSVAIGIAADTGALLAQYRDELIKWFAPVNDVILKVVRNDDSERLLVVHYVGDFSMPSSDRTGPFQTVGIALKAPESWFYEPDNQDELFSIGAGSDAFVVPAQIPTGVGTSTIDSTKAINYGGSWYAYPLIRVAGPITNPVITNETLGLKLDFTGITITGSDYYDIDCRFGYNTVIDKAGNNKIADLTDDSDLGEFRIEPPSKIAPTGINSLRVTGSGATLQTAVSMTFRVNHLGV